MLRILHVIGSMECGGAETMIMNIYRNIDRTKVQFDFVLHTQKVGLYEAEILKLGGKIYRTNKYTVLNFIQYKKWWNTFLNEHGEYRIIHGHINSSAAIYLSVAKKRGLKTIVHSHATKNNERSLRNLVFQIMSYPIRFIADYFMACSRQAGIDRFGSKIVESEHFRVLANGIDVRKYKFCKNKRVEIRKELEISDEVFAICHVGRFTYAKNHDFAIEIFLEILERKSNAMFFLFGDGELKNLIEKKVKQYGVEDKIKFMGIKNNIYDYLQGMDCFLFPSLFEGLGIALIEAQATGLRCVVSEAIQKEADIKAGLVEYLPLMSEKVDVWAEKCCEACEFKDRIDVSEKVIAAGYDIYNSAYEIMKFYLEFTNDLESNKKNKI